MDGPLPLMLLTSCNETNWDFLWKGQAGCTPQSEASSTGFPALYRQPPALGVVPATRGLEHGLNRGHDDLKSMSSGFGFVLFWMTPGQQRCCSHERPGKVWSPPRAMISLLFLSSSNRQLPKQGQLRSIQVVSCKKSTNQFILGGGEGKEMLPVVDPQEVPAHAKPLVVEGASGEPSQAIN